MGFLLTLSLYISTIFTIIISLFGFSYTSADDSPLYIIIVLGLDVVILCYIVTQEILHHKEAQGKMYTYLLLLLIPFLWFMEMAIKGITDNAVRMLQLFFAISSPGFLVGTYCYRYNKFNLIVKNLELLALICTIGLILALPTMYSTGHSSIGGAGNHQIISYTAAINFATFFVSMKNKNIATMYHYPFFRSKVYGMLVGIIMIINAVICIIGGGRGAAVLLILSAIASFYYFSKGKFLQSTLLLAIGIIFFYFIATNVSLWNIDKIFQTGFDRAFSYIGPDGLNTSQTSGRDIVYEKAQEMIKNVPVFGYGLFHQYDLCQKIIGQPYCHNIFYEWILQGGYLYLLFWISLYLLTLYKANKLIKNSPPHAYLIAIMGYPVVMLMFSGTYMNTPLFWFSVIYVLNCRVTYN